LPRARGLWRNKQKPHFPLLGHPVPGKEGTEHPLAQVAQLPWKDPTVREAASPEAGR
jgi:hypothetical protein